MARSNVRVGIGAQIREVRMNMGLSQAAFADLLQLHKGTVAVWERDWQMPSDSALQLISRASGVFLGALKASAVECKAYAQHTGIGAST